MNDIRRFGEESKWIWFILAAALYAVRVMPCAMSELWYDEVLTLTDFSLDLSNRGVAASILRNYTMANNHILNSLVYWGWVRLLNFNLLPEALLRFPSLMLGLGTIALCVLHWRKWLGGRTAALGGVLLALSPIFTNYVYQIRGYSLTIFLSALCVSGALEYYDGKHRLGHFLGISSGILLPLVMPSNVILAPLAAVMYESVFPLKNVKEKLRASLPILIAFGIGGAYYLTIWGQFLKTTHEPAGWKSAWLVMGCLMLAVLAHILVLLPPIAQNIKKSINALKGEKTSLQLWPLVLFAGPLILTSLLLAVSRSGHAPYPRVFLVFLPQITFGALLLTSRIELSPKAYVALLAAVIMNALLWERIPTEITQAQLKRGISPSNLLQQYYRGSTELRSSMETVSEAFPKQDLYIITDEYDFPTTQLYSLLYSNGAKAQVTTFNRSAKGDWSTIPSYSRPRLVLIAKTDAAARRLSEHAGIDKKLKTVKRLEIRTIYTIE